MKVSVVIPAYRPAALDAALDSVRAQTFHDWELIVVDDGSPEPVRPARTDDLTLIRQDNQGAGGARNTGVAQARGEYLAFLDCDDRWLPDKLAQQVAAHGMHPEWVLSTTDARWTAVDGRVTASQLARYRLRGETIPTRALFRENCIITSAAMVRREAWPGMPVGRWAEDYDAWLRLALAGPVGLVPQVLVERFEQGDGFTAAVSRAGKLFAAEEATYREVVADFPTARGYLRGGLARLEFQRGWTALRQGDCAAARRDLRSSLRREPWRWAAWKALGRALVSRG